MENEPSAAHERVRDLSPPAKRVKLERETGEQPDTDNFDIELDFDPEEADQVEVKSELSKEDESDKKDPDLNPLETAQKKIDTQKKLDIQREWDIKDGLSQLKELIVTNETFSEPALQALIYTYCFHKGTPSPKPR